MSLLVTIAGTILSLALLTVSTIGGFAYGSTKWVVQAVTRDDTVETNITDSDESQWYRVNMKTLEMEVVEDERILK